jgi:hypothetical protein
LEKIINEKKYYFTKEKNKNSYYMIIKTGNESKIELKEGLNEENKKSRSLSKKSTKKIEKKYLY